MKKVLLFFTLALAATAFSACVNEREASDAPVVTIRASVPEEPFAKASFTVPVSGPGLHLAWQGTDQIRVINAANAAQSALYDIQAGYTDHQADFAGPAVSGTSYNVLCPGSFASVEEAAAGAVLTQEGNGSTAHLEFTALLSNVPKANIGEITFSDAWVAAHLGTSLKKGGIMKFALTLPNAVSAPKKLMMTGIGADIELNITGVSTASNHVLTAYAPCGWEDVAIPPYSVITVGVIDEDGSYYAADLNISASGKSVKAGYQNIITVSNAASFTERLFAGGDGTQGDPYLIASAKQLDNMHADRIDPNTGDPILKHGERVYFRMIADIDMQDYLSANRWIPLNAVNPYDYIIDFDGDNHTIDHFTCTFDLNSDSQDSQKDPSFFGLLYGSCRNVRFTNANVSTNNGPCGVLGGYLGYSGKRAIVQNVHIQGQVKKTTNTGTHGVGGMAGVIQFAYIDSSSADVSITSSDQWAGGLVGHSGGESSRIRNCWTSGTVYGDQKVGGIVGAFINAETEIINCYSTATVNATRFAGCIIGETCMDAGGGTPRNYTLATTLMPENVVKGCIAWQTSLVTRDQAGVKDGWASGAIIGLTATHNYLTDCKRHPSFVLDDFSEELLLYDQENASPSSALVINNPNTKTYTHYYPYHGKAATNSNLSTVAQGLGWSNVAWDFSGSIPVLTGAVQADDPAETPVSGDADVPFYSTTARAFPSNNYTKNGLTWTVSEIRDGIRYYRGYGKPTDSWWADTYSTSAANKCQEIFVVDLDLSNTDYDVKIVVASPSAPTSEVFRQTGAIAAINGGYERGSIAVKGNMFLDTDNEEYTNYPFGYPYSYMPNNTIGDRGVANWKSEGAFYCDGHQGVRIAFDAYNGGATGKDRTGTTGTTLKSVKQMRRFYKECTDNEAGFISSAPILDANYTRFGMSFYSRAASGSDGESPKVHQGSCYSRTAVGIAYPNGDENEPHLLLVVNDGKYTNESRGYGMSAYQLERVMANFFGPKYLLNLDGGGSTTMCVEGKGDEDTHVVNYPSDNYTGKIDTGHVDHAGERSRDTFIVIVPAE